MLLDQMMSVMEKLVKEIRETEPEKRDHFLKITSELFTISAEAIRISPEFRQGFALVHTEFLKYPECRETVEQSLAAYKQFVQ